MKPGKELTQELEWPRHINRADLLAHMSLMDKASVHRAASQIMDMQRHYRKSRDIRNALFRLFRQFRRFRRFRWFRWCGGESET